MTTQPRTRLGRIFVGGLVLVSMGFATASSAIQLDPSQVKADPAINDYYSSASGDYVGWTANSEGALRRQNAFVQFGEEPRVRANAAGTSGEAGGFDGTAFVYTQWSDTRSPDIWRMNVITNQRVKFGTAVNTRYSEFYPTISGKWLLFTRFNWADNRYRVVLFNRETGGSRVLAAAHHSTPVLAGQVNGDWVTYFRVSDNSAAYRYRISTRQTFTLPNSARHAYASSVGSDGTVFYVRSGNACGANADLLRYPVGGPAEKVLDVASGIDIQRSWVDDRADQSREIHYTRMDCDRSALRWLDAYKVADAYTLTVAKAGTGAGTVTDNLGGIDCGSDCTQPLARGTTVTLTATADQGFGVISWSVPSCGSATQCEVEILGNQTVTVTFGPVV